MKFLCQLVALCVFVLLTLLPGASAMLPKEQRFTVEEINANPTILNNLHLKHGKLNGIDIKNALIKNLTLEDVAIYDGKFTNITFENCTFKKVDFIENMLSNVAFIKCKLISLDDTYHHQKITNIIDSTFYNVMFQETELTYLDANITGNDGFILFKNVTKTKPMGKGGGSIINILNAQVRVDNSRINGTIAGRKDVNAITKNTKYVDGGIYCDQNFILNSEIQNSTVGARKILVLKDSIADGGSNIDGKGYFINNTYLSTMEELFSGRTQVHGFGIDVSEGSHAYVLAKDNKPTALRLFGGEITLKNFTLVDTIIGTNLGRMPPISALNLQNTTITGGSWKGKILGGKWEDVRITPTVLVNRADIQNVLTHRLEFPKGPPWQQKGDFVFNVKESNTPFEWPDIKVPTPEELGLVWWPDVEPGYHGK